jgi:hypothetical protein
MAKVFADHHNATITTNDFALVANFLHARFYFHDPSPSIKASGTIFFAYL